MEKRLGGVFNFNRAPFDAHWNDLGACDAVRNLGPKCDSGNAQFGDAQTTDSRDTLVDRRRSPRQPDESAGYGGGNA